MASYPFNNIHNPVQFTKLHGTGNSFICLDYTRCTPHDCLSDLASAITDCNKGIGADGMIVILPSETATVRMLLYNPDGTKANGYGNSLRCVALYARATGITSSSLITVETDNGIISTQIEKLSDRHAVVTVDMGYPDFNSPNLPVTRDAFGRVILTAGERAFTIFPVSMGYPHGIVFTDDLSDSNFLSNAPLISSHPRWPKNATVEFVHKTGNGLYDIRVWEPGHGETQACGTGACAVAAAAWLTGCTTPIVTMRLKGGILSVTRQPDSGNFMLTGPSTIVANGVFYLTPTE